MQLLSAHYLSIEEMQGLLWFVLKSLAFLFLLMPVVYFFVIFSRNKLIADMQARVGFSRTLAAGAMVPVELVWQEIKKRISYTPEQRSALAIDAVFCFLFYLLSELKDDKHLFRADTVMLFLLCVFLYKSIYFLFFNFEKKTDYISAFKKILISGLSISCAVLTTILAGFYFENDGISSLHESFSIVFLLLYQVIFVFCGMIIFEITPFYSCRIKTINQSGYFKAASDFFIFVSFWVWTYFGFNLFLNELVFSSFYLKAILTTFFVIAVQIVSGTIPKLDVAQTLKFVCMYLLPITLGLLLFATAMKMVTQ